MGISFSTHSIARRYDSGFNPPISLDTRPSGPSWQRQSMNLLQHNNIDKRWFSLPFWATLGALCLSDYSPHPSQQKHLRVKHRLISCTLFWLKSQTDTVCQTDRQPVSQAIRQSKAVRQLVSQAGTCSLEHQRCLFFS